MIKTIFVATDGSVHAKKAIDLAADIAGKYGARMVILHVLLRDTSESKIEALCKENEMPDALEMKFEEMRKAFLEVVAVSYVAGPLFIPIPDDLLNDVGDLILNDTKRRAASKGVKSLCSYRRCAACGNDCRRRREGERRHDLHRKPWSWKHCRTVNGGAKRDHLGGVRRDLWAHGVKRGLGGRFS